MLYLLLHTSTGVLTGRHIEIEVEKCGGKMQGKCGNEMANSSKWENKSNFRGKYRNKGDVEFIDACI